LNSDSEETIPLAPGNLNFGGEVLNDRARMWNAGSIFRILRVSHSMQSPALYSCSLVCPLITDVFCAYNPEGIPEWGADQTAAWNQATIEGG
jgi:hypothetical protein